MSEYLRDFINENVGDDCVSSGSYTSIQTTLNECLSRLDKLEAGISFTGSIKDKITISFNQVDDTFVAVIPSDGTISSVSILTDIAGLSSLTVTQKSSDGTLSTNTYDLNSSNRSSTTVTSIAVSTDDWLEVVTTTDSEDTIPTVLTCSAVLTLAAKSYGVTSA